METIKELIEEILWVAADFGIHVFGMTVGLVVVIAIWAAIFFLVTLPF